jgi:hypothetical protein
MLQRQISRSPDLKRLRDNGYDVLIKAGHLVVRSVPYVDSNCDIQYGLLVSELTLAGDVTARPSDHVAMFSGAAPCDRHGNVLSKILNSSERRELGDGLVVHHTFSSKPSVGYADYYDKMTTYIRIISGPAIAIDETVTAMMFPVIEEDDEASVFNYLDTASSRAGINVVSQKLGLRKVAVVGLGGTGSYVLDLVAKTPVHELHLFDGDMFLQHNAFRSPGAPSVEELRAEPHKVAHFAQQYSKMRRNIIPHPYYLDASNAEELHEMDFVFLCIDKGTPKRALVTKLEEFETQFIDVGMGVQEVDGELAGVLRITTSTPSQRSHVAEKNRIPFTDGDGDDYGSNIQIADLNALNAALAVVKWKKLFGFYRDLEEEHFSAYTTDGNHLTNEDQAT